MRQQLLIVAAGGLVVMSGCSLKFNRGIRVADKLLGTHTVAKDDIRGRPPVKGLSHLARQARGETHSPPSPESTVSLSGRVVSVRYVDADSPMSPELATNVVTRKIIEASEAALAGRFSEVDTKISVFEYRGFAEILLRSVDRLHDSADTQKEFARLFHGEVQYRRTKKIDEKMELSLAALTAAYLQAYFTDGFVDRKGTRLIKSKLTTSIGNDTISAIQTVILEALFDYAYLTPALFSEIEDYVATFVPDTPPYFKQVYERETLRQFNTENLAPTFVTLYPQLQQAIQSDVKDFGKEGVSDTELLAIRFLTSLSSEQSKHLSALLFRFLGGAHASFVLGGNFSFGDNDTMATLVDTLSDEFARRTTEAIAYYVFNSFVYTEERPPNAPPIFSLTLENKKTNAYAPLRLSDAEQEAILNLLQWQGLLKGLMTSQP